MSLKTLLILMFLFCIIWTTACSSGERLCASEAISKPLSSITEIFTASEKTALTKPSGITAVSDGGQVKVSWGTIENAKNYAVYRSAEKEGEYKYIGHSQTTSYVDKEEPSSKKSYYKVCAFGGKFGESKSELSEPCEVFVKLAKPSVSSSFDKGSQYVTVSWKAVKDAEKYYIYKQTSSGGYSKISETANLSYTGMVSKNGVHQYKVAGVYTQEGKNHVGNLSNATAVIVSSIVKPSTGKMVALTFDDGPGPYTQRIVDCLAKNNARATFFVLGQNVGRYPSAVKSAYNNGNEIASHSYSHPMLYNLSTDGILSQMKRTDDAVAKVIGKATNLMRPPGGGINNTVKSTVGKPIIMWSIDTLDWKTRDKVQTINSVMSKVRDGDIILLHDIHKPTMEAVLELIPMLKNEGYQLVTVSELARSKGYTLQSGKVYYSLR
ncbi:MAG: polysaccharide deacetylase family protein [Firmicutes bacterium]|nr:polysaccharide deacetylase family protein [Bacillota bacterium]